jgi:hypothetical protein
MLNEDENLGNILFSRLLSNAMVWWAQPSDNGNANLNMLAFYNFIQVLDAPPLGCKYTCSNSWRSTHTHVINGPHWSVTSNNLNTPLTSINPTIGPRIIILKPNTQHTNKHLKHTNWPIYQSNNSCSWKYSGYYIRPTCVPKYNH